MITSVLQMLVFVAAAAAFAWYVLRVDKREHLEKRTTKDQYEIKYDVEEHEHKGRGAAMSRL